MTAFYNDTDKQVCAAVRLLIEQDLIAPGVVDERPIEDISPVELRGFRQVHLFCGTGGWSYALRLAGWPDDRPVWTCSCPCQPFSDAGKGAGFEDERHLWPAVQHLVAQCQPPVILGEQVASKRADPWIDLVHADLENLGYAFGSVPFPAAGVGAKHERERNYWAARHITNAERYQEPREEPCCGKAGRVGRIEQPLPWDEPWPSALSRFRVLGDGLPRSVGACDAARNAIVPQQAAAFIAAYMEAA